MASGSTIAQRLDRVASLLEDHRDIVETRAAAAETPAWCAVRGWDGWLADLGDEALARCEALGLPASPDLQGAPASLRAVCAEVRACTALPRLLPTATTPEALESVGARKHWQIQALLDAASELCRDASRIVEIGAGRGHLTRVAAHRFAREAVGIERDAGRVRRATELAARHGVDAVRFIAADALEGELPLAAGDLALGLHACGEVGDHLVAGAARAGFHLAFVACCAQKIRGPAREPLSVAAAGRRVPGSRATLGLANLGGGAHGHGIEATVPASMDAREARWSLRWLLAQRGVATAPGEEMRGVNRRRARGGLPLLVGLALEARGRHRPATRRSSAAGSRSARVRAGAPAGLAAQRWPGAGGVPAPRPRSASRRARPPGARERLFDARSSPPGAAGPGLAAMTTLGPRRGACATAPSAAWRCGRMTGRLGANLGLDPAGSAHRSGCVAMACSRWSAASGAWSKRGVRPARRRGWRRVFRPSPAW
ncbi:MAG: methyltransferase [Polyangiaceae bacterium]